MNTAIQQPRALTLANGVTVSVSADAPFSLSMGAALQMLAPAYPSKDLDDATLAAYDALLRNYPPEIVAAASVEIVNRQKWFPTVSEIAEAVRNLAALIVPAHAGLYARDKSGHERAQAIRAWERDCLPDTQAFIERARTDERLRSAAAALYKRR